MSAPVAPAARPPRALFYVQHLLGIGHLARASRIAAAMAADGFEVTMVTGGLPVPGFPGPGVAHVALPPIRSGDAGFTGLTDAEGRPVDDAFKAMRRDRLLETFREAGPDVVIIEAFPFGRRQVRFELLPLIEAIAASRPRPLLVSSVRDILQANRKPGRDAETAELVERAFDAVLVHGDPAFVRLEDSFPEAARIADRVQYTGLVAPVAPAAPAAPAERHDVTVSAGGGAVGRALIEAAVGAARLMPDLTRWCVVTGPNLPQGEYDAIAAAAPSGVTLHRFREDFVRVLAGSRLSVSQAGYNTVCDVLVAGCRSVLLPFAAGGETEQGVRAERLAAQGRAVVLPEEGLTPERMVEAIRRALRGPDPARIALDLDGAAGTARILRAMIGGHAARAR
ncbi:glycosyltransferase family protein [Acidimangrovimonas sediminis]|uniref:glycosyltransferase family protein n=1 Tax=Acidimangrovimonas sediminis TaxID=2056283 RepID=UPI000C8043C0|nr:glycosyltransferase [Acidimangrovimonas sediminis]